MVTDDFEQLVAKGIQETDGNNSLLGIMYLEKASRIRRTPLLNSYLGFCMAKERKNLRDAVLLCSEALKEDPDNLVFYRNLAHVYLLANQRKNAIKVLREATKRGRDEEVMQIIKDLGIRKEPVLSFLSRSNPLNIFLGRLRSKIFG